MRKHICFATDWCVASLFRYQTNATLEACIGQVSVDFSSCLNQEGGSFTFTLSQSSHISTNDEGHLILGQAGIASTRKFRVTLVAVADDSKRERKAMCMRLNELGLYEAADAVMAYKIKISVTLEEHNPIRVVPLVIDEVTWTSDIQGWIESALGIFTDRYSHD